MLLNRIKILKKQLPNIYITNQNYKGEEQRRAVYFIKKENVQDRRGNVILELWETKEDHTFDLYFKREYLTNEEYEESKKHYRTTSSRGVLRRTYTDIELIKFIKEKLNEFCVMDVEEENRERNDISSDGTFVTIIDKIINVFNKLFRIK